MLSREDAKLAKKTSGGHFDRREKS